MNTNFLSVFSAAKIPLLRVTSRLKKGEKGKGEEKRTVEK